jgi:ribose 1,5-bisphosphokinase
MTPQIFQESLLAGEFALRWNANGLDYGIRHSQLEPLQRQQWVILNGSRAYLNELALAYPQVTVLLITADHDVLRARLKQRGRERIDEIEARLARIKPIQMPLGSQLITVNNNGSLEASGNELLTHLLELVSNTDSARSAQG